MGWVVVLQIGVSQDEGVSEGKDGFDIGYVVGG